MNQSERLLKYLQENGKIDPLQAWTELGIYRLAARILELRQDYNIISNNTEAKNKYGEKVRFATYIYVGKKEKNTIKGRKWL